MSRWDSSEAKNLWLNAARPSFLIGGAGVPHWRRAEPGGRCGRWAGQSPAPMEVPAKPRHVLEADIISALKEVYDPELPVNIYDLGLIYAIDVQDAGRVDVKMTLTAPGCPAAQFLPGQVEEKVAGVDGVAEAHVELVWEPPYHKGLMSEEARLDLGLF